MTTPTTNMALLKGTDTDNAKTYLETNLGASLDTIDAHDHSTNAKGLAVARLAASTALAAGGTTFTTGGLGIGVAPTTQWGLQVGGASLFGSQGTVASIFASGAGPSTATTEISGVYSQPATAAAAFTAGAVECFHAVNPSKGAGSTITSAYGLLVDAITVGGTNNYGIKATGASGGSGDNIAILGVAATNDSTTNALVARQANGTTAFSVNGGGVTTLAPSSGQQANIGGLSLSQVGFYGATPVTKQGVSGSKGGNVALGNLLSALATLGLITDNTT